MWKGSPKEELPKARQRKIKNKKYDRGSNDKRTEVKGGQLHTIFTSLVGVQSGIDFSDLGEDDEFSWHPFHVKGWGE